MKASAIREGFNGYGSHPLAESEKLIRNRIIACMDELNAKNDQCMARARDEGREKLVSEIESLKKRMEKMRRAMELAGSGARFKFEKLSSADEKRLRELDLKLESLFSECAGLFEGLSCSETDLHIIEHYSRMNAHLGGIEQVFHERMKIFRMMYVFG